MEQLRRIRKKNGTTQVQISKFLKIDQTTYSGYETGKSEPNFATVKLLADYFHVTIDELLGHEVPYTLNRVEFSQEQLDLIEQIKSLNAKQCEKVCDFVSGIIEAQKIKDNTLKRFNQ